jgi:hypothetical protein
MFIVETAYGIADEDEKDSTAAGAFASRGPEWFIK